MRQIDANALLDMTFQTQADKRIRISILLPVYNVADFLPECLQSIVHQSFDHEIEALLIDDCSTDDSKLICENFVREYPDLFKLIANAENRGVSVARNIGLDNARGDYFMFVDPDDVLPLGALQNLYTAATQNDSDIVKGNNTIFNEHSEHGARYNVSSEIMVTGDEVLTTLYRHSQVRGHPWGKLFNRKRLGEVRFPVGVRMAQDLYYCGEVFGTARTLLLIDKPVYRYRNRDTGSTGRKYETGAYLHWLDSVEKIGSFAKSRQQITAHRGLQIRTMAQIARECRKIPPDIAAQVLVTIEQKCNDWNVRLSKMITGGGAGLLSLVRYLKFQLALYQIRRGLARSR
jgi:glycosyltransferase involved in cell wall biosynthesis